MDNENVLRCRVRKSQNVLREMMHYRVEGDSRYKEVLDAWKETQWDFDFPLMKLDIGFIRFVFYLREKINMHKISLIMKNAIFSDIESGENNGKIKHIFFIALVPNLREMHYEDLGLEKECQKLNLTYEIYHLDELQYNVTRHTLVPRHTLVDREDQKTKADIMSRLQINQWEQLPHILTIDPVARFIGAREKDVVCIRRATEHSGEHVLYRYCMRPVKK